MPQSRQTPAGHPPGTGWFVYVVRCADASLYTGVTTDVARRLRQHNAGTASRYTRSRRPVELVYREAGHSHGSSLRREAAIKAMGRPRKKPAKGVREVARLEDIPNVGPAVAGDLRRLGITTPAGLPGRDPYALYDELCRVTGQCHDPCVLDTLIAAVRTWRGRRSGRGGRTRRSGSGRWRLAEHRVVEVRRRVPAGYETAPALEKGLAAYSVFYNEARLHQSIGYKTPAEVYRGGRSKEPAMG